MSVTIRVFDPAMCCSTGVCGPSVDPELRLDFFGTADAARQGAPATTHPSGM